MNEFVKSDNILLAQHAESREDAIRIISTCAVDLGIATDAEAVYQGFMAREQLDKTGLTEGFAVPHCKSAAIDRAGVIVLRNAAALEWPSLDEQPVDVAVALLVPDAEAGTTHLQLLTKIAVCLMDDGFKKMLRESDNSEDIASAINGEISK